MINHYSSYNNGLKIGDLVHYEYKNFPYFSTSCSKTRELDEHGVVLDRELLFTNETKWGKRNFFSYKIMNFSGKIYKIKTQNIKILKRTGAL